MQDLKKINQKCLQAVKWSIKYWVLWDSNPWLKCNYIADDLKRSRLWLKNTSKVKIGLDFNQTDHYCCVSHIFNKVSSRPEARKSKNRVHNQPCCVKRLLSHFNTFLVLFLNWDLYSLLLRVNSATDKLKQPLAGKENLDEALVRNHSCLTWSCLSLTNRLHSLGCTVVIIQHKNGLLNQINALCDALNININNVRNEMRHDVSYFSWQALVFWKPLMF